MANKHLTDMRFDRTAAILRSGHRLEEADLPTQARSEIELSFGDIARISGAETSRSQGQVPGEYVHSLATAGKPATLCWIASEYMLTFQFSDC